MGRTVSVGISALDKALMEGVPRGFTMLATGVPGSGMELLAKQFASAGSRDEHVAFFTTHESDEDIVDTMQEYGWKSDLTIVNIGNLYYESVLAKRLEASRYRLEGISIKDVARKKAHEAGLQREVNFLTTLAYEVSRMKPPLRVVIDSLDFFLQYYEHPEVMSAVRTVKAHVQRTEGLALFTVLAGIHDAKTQSGIEGIVDAIFELERVREADAFRRYLVIRKVRNHPDKTGIYPLAVTKSGLELG